MFTYVALRLVSFVSLFLLCVSDSSDYSSYGYYSGSRLLMSAFIEEENFDDGFCMKNPLLKTLEVETMWDCEDLAEIWRRIENKEEGAGTLVGEGYWRSVYQVTYKGRDVVYKRMKRAEHDDSGSNRRRQWREAAAIQLANSDAVVQILGMCDYDVVTDHMKGGDLWDFLFEREDKTPLPVEQALRLAFEASLGVVAIHELPGGGYVHADIKPHQYLIDEHGTLRLNDYNRGYFVETHNVTGEPCPHFYSVGNGRWRAPEELCLSLVNEKIDVYALGMVIWSIFSLKRPFTNYSSRSDSYRFAALSGERPVIDPSWPAGIAELLPRMWHVLPAERPSAREAMEKLQDILEQATTTPFL